ncbi:MAG: SWIM zinc finger family protein [Candidatus Acidiferrum sp.]
MEGRTIARTFWGKAWCDNLERYSDFLNRLPRGRSYLRNGLVIDLDLGGGGVKALVCGSSIYQVAVKIAPVTKARWKSICQDCAGGIDSLVELLQGRFSKGVMERVCLQKTGLFPSPGEIEFSCSCPDWADMCKHVAAVLYGIGARLDKQPELLFKLNQVDPNELIAKAGMDFPLTRKRPNAERILSRDDLSELFGLDLVRHAATSASSSGTPVKPSNKKIRAEKRIKRDRNAGLKRDTSTAATTRTPSS